MRRHLIWLTLMSAALIALPSAGIFLVADAGAATHHHKKHHKHHHKKKKSHAPCGGLADSGTAPNTNGAVQFECNVTVNGSFSVTTNKTLVAAQEGSQSLPFALSQKGRFACKLTGSHSFSCNGPTVPPPNSIKAFWREQEGCAGLQVSVTVSGKVSRIPVAAACR